MTDPAEELMYAQQEAERIAERDAHRHEVLRDAFARSAMQGILSVESIVSSVPAETIAHWAYEQADAMLKERGLR